MKIGYAMYSARDITRNPASLREVLMQLAKMGYEGVEFFQYHDTEPEVLKAMLAEFGLAAIGTHVHKPRWDADMNGEIEYAAAAGIPRLVYPWIEPGLRTETFYRRLPAILKELSEHCSVKGIQLQYHNHDFEFAGLGTGTVMDYLLAAEASFTFELDTFWAWYSGVDAVEYMQKYGRRIPMIHIKDYLGEVDGVPQFAPIGTGQLDNTKVIQAAAEMQKEWLIVELDNSPLDPLASAQISIESIRKIVEKI